MFCSTTTITIITCDDIIVLCDDLSSNTTARPLPLHPELIPPLSAKDTPLTWTSRLGGEAAGQQGVDGTLVAKDLQQVGDVAGSREGEAAHHGAPQGGQRPRSGWEHVAVLEVTGKGL